MATEGWARGRKKAGGQEKGTWSKILCAFCPHPDATSPPLPTTGALAFCPFLPPSAQLLKPCKGAALLPPLLWGAGWEGGLGGPDAGATGALLMAGPTVACRFPSSGDCSSPPEQVAAHCAAGGGRAATAAAPGPGAAAQPTARAWPAAGELQTLGQRGRLAGPGKEQQRAGDEELRSRAEGEEEGG